MHCNIIFEGHDGAGKTSIINKLLQVDNFVNLGNLSPYVTLKDKKLSDMERHFYLLGVTDAYLSLLSTLSSQQSVKDFTFLKDRFFVSTCVYDLIYRDFKFSRIKDNLDSYIKLFLGNNPTNTIFVNLYCDYASHVSRKREDPLPEDVFHSTKNLFATLFNHLDNDVKSKNHRVVNIDTSLVNVDESCELILKVLSTFNL